MSVMQDMWRSHLASNVLSYIGAISAYERSAVGAGLGVTAGDTVLSADARCDVFHTAISECYHGKQWEHAGKLSKEVWRSQGGTWRYQLERGHQRLRESPTVGACLAPGAGGVAGAPKLERGVTCYSAAIIGCEKGKQWEHSLNLFQEM